MSFCTPSSRPPTRVPPHYLPLPRVVQAMGSSKASSPTGDRDAEVAKLRKRVNDLERERERLIHSTRKAENMADKNYLLSQQYFSMIKNKEDKNDKQDTEVAQLLREAKAKAERAEENANVQVRNLQAKLDEMSKRALEAENALKDEKHQRETTHQARWLGRC
ncbi:hypothetical protein PHYSODRAFT_328002 [Phytophthora sojae]|uniref:Uncharacterized protein n=1 Tax=Phytophthora sojae (strain P6497) TaxID=1094619 RepID=G4ZAN5_PHYSP|nr:hypothetical protein PHYSODRAFT_328002 [Phytophthora sojae]EGZ19821.1 hypothetical protein PHYSODRAFT_328002 [Phytophthora sojae]|eukprot:XP_009522538.1 hypothetical protein PHYSODRAFT_328002 [Phytophthora sojae]